MRVLLNDKVWDKDAIVALLNANPKAVARALLVIYANQTADERRIGETVEHNGIGFSGKDSEFLSDVAVKWQRWGRWASARQCAAVRRCMVHYHRQILQHMLDTNPNATKIVGRYIHVPAAIVAPAQQPVTEQSLYGRFA